MSHLSRIASGKRYWIGLVFIGLFLIVCIFVLDWQQVFRAVRDLSPGALLVALGCIVVTQFVSASRFFFLIRSFARDLKWLRALQANMAGHLGSLVLIQLVGQIAGRQSILAAHGLRPATLALTTLIERALVAGVGLAGFLGGVLTVFSTDILDDILNQVQILPLLGAALLAALVSFVVAGTRIEKALVSRLLARRTGLLLIGSALLSILGWAAMLGAFVVILRAVAPQVGLVDAFAASAIVSFAAALPVSINGWGVRELAAIWAFGQLGVGPADAAVASVTVGVLSTLAILGLSPVLLVRRAGVLAPTDAAPAAQAEAEAEAGAGATANPARKLADVAGAWILGLATSVLIFFQFHSQVRDTPINLNLADPIALLALTVLALHAITDRRVPDFRVRWMIPALGLCTAVIVLSFARGVIDFGVTSWALNNRLLGWVILMGYLSAGAYLVAIGGRAGQRRLVETLLFTLAVVVLVETTMRTLALSELIRLNTSAIFQGFSGNRNAYAFAALITLALAVPLLHVEGRRRLYVWAVRLSVGFAIFGVWASQSRAGIGTLALVLVYLMAVSPRTRRACLIGLAVAAGLVVFMAAVPALVDVARTLVHLAWPLITDLAAWIAAVARWLWESALWLLAGMPADQDGRGGLPGFFVLKLFWSSGEILRWESIALGFRLWLDHPWIGAGLGSYVATYQDPETAALVIHNTAVWLLAETGLLGTAVFVLAFAGLVWAALRRGLAPGDDWRLALLLCLAIFGTFSLVHEMAYQRIFWLALGIVLAGYTLRGAPSRADGRASDQPWRQPPPCRPDGSPCAIAFSAAPITPSTVAASAIARAAADAAAQASARP